MVEDGEHFRGMLYKARWDSPQEGSIDGVMSFPIILHTTTTTTLNKVKTVIKLLLL